MLPLSLSDTQVMHPNARTPVQADSSCTVIAAMAAGSPEPNVEAGVATSKKAAVVACGDDSQLPAASSTPAVPESFRGPLMAARPTSLRQTGNGGSLQQQRPATAADCPANVLSKSPRRLFSGEQIPDLHQGSQRRSDWFARLFTCLGAPDS